MILTNTENDANYFLIKINNVKYFIGLNYKNTWYKFEKMTYVNTLYKNINLEVGNCDFIKEYHAYLIDKSPISYQQEAFNEMLKTIKNCDDYQADYLFLKSFNEKKLVLPHEEFQAIKLISEYWYFIPNKQKDSLSLLFKKNDNKELINLFIKEFK